MVNKNEKEIYFKYADEMFSLCYRYIRDIEIAEEILNNGFIKVFKNRKNFKPQGENSLKHWMKKIMINECLMYLRKKKKIRTEWIENINENQIRDFNNQFIVTNKTIEKDEIDELIQKLPVGYRTIFNLYAIDGYSHKEIAKKLKINESTSRSQLTMARKKLKEMLIKKGLIYE
ncbi:MAG: RNA polymerase subunit sigma-70 [Candidatus Zixiibacteriota bacterium]|nr:MAG: RNA polymerase subunit sigma-70 [candidate division Zixibacteria bacterium]